MYGFPLLFAQIADIIHFADVAQVGKQFVGIDQVLVDVVEVGNEQLPPAVEVVNGLVEAGDGRICLMQVADQFDRVGQLKSGVADKQVGDGHVGRRPDRLPCKASQGIVEEERRPLVWKDDGGTRQVGSKFSENIFCGMFEERCHRGGDGSN